MTKPKAVLITDIHYTPSTLELADAALNQALRKAEELNVPLIIKGDTLDTKAVMRGECVNALIKTFKKHYRVKVIMLIGNHELINEKGKEHTLHFLEPYATIVDPDGCQLFNEITLVSYQSDPEDFKAVLKATKESSIVLCHQGVKNANMGHYHQDKSSVDTKFLSKYRIISGHYHAYQNIHTGLLNPENLNEGLFTYLGNPYTLSFGEANDPVKGYGILYEDGTLERIPTKLRKHIIIEGVASSISKEILIHNDGPMPNPEDLVWVKLRGTQSSLAKWNKSEIADLLGISPNFKLDKIATTNKKEIKLDKQTDAEILDNIIDKSLEKDDHKKQLKKLWRSLM